MLLVVIVNKNLVALDTPQGKMFHKTAHHMSFEVHGLTNYKDGFIVISLTSPPTVEIID